MCAGLPGVGYTLRLKDRDGHFEPGNVRVVKCRPNRYDPLEVERTRLVLLDAAEAKGCDPLIYAAQWVTYLSNN